MLGVFLVLIPMFFVPMLLGGWVVWFALVGSDPQRAERKEAEKLARKGH